LDDRTRLVHGCVVHEDVHAAPSLGQVDGLAGGRLARHIAGQEFRPLRTNVGHQLRPRSGAPGDDDDPGALADEQANRGLPDAACASGDDGDLAREPAAHRARARSARNSNTMLAATNDVLSATSYAGMTSTTSKPT